MKTNKPGRVEKLPRMSPQESAEFQARLDAVIATGVERIKRDQLELVRRGILDAEGNRIKPFVPPICLGSGISGLARKSTRNCEQRGGT
jgi:hypothetical protein